MSTHGFADLMTQRAFVRLWFARLASTSATQMMMVAIGWQMYDLTGSAWDLGLVGLYQFVPALLLTLVAGQLADQLRRDRIVAACLLVQALVALTLALASEQRWATRELLLMLSIALGAVRAFQMPAQQALTPLLVPPSMLARAMAFSSAGSQAAIIGGPALGGVVFVAGAGAVYALCCALLCTGFVLMLRLGYVHAPPRAPVTLESLFSGVFFIWRAKLLLGAVSLDLFAVLLGGATALLPIFARDILHTGPWGLGLLRASPAIGALAIATLLTRWPIERKVGARLLWAVALFGASMVAFGLSTNLALSMAALIVSGGADMVSVVVRQTLVQLETPDAMRGRVGAVNSVFIGASNQLGEFESGATAAWLGPVGSVLLGGVGTLLIAALWSRLFRALAQRDKMAS